MTDTPFLAKLFGRESKVLKKQLNIILMELFQTLGNKSASSVNFEYKNGVKGRAVIVPRVKSEDSFQRQAKKLNWMESILEHVSEKNEAAKWMSCYLGKNYEGSFTLALDALGLPVVQRLDEKSTAAMWADDNIKYMQQRIIKRHLRLHLGKRLFIPDSAFNADHERYFAPTYYNEYRYYKKCDKTQKPE
jgi:hypothetical protein